MFFSQVRNPTPPIIEITAATRKMGQPDKWPQFPVLGGRRGPRSSLWREVETETSSPLEVFITAGKAVFNVGYGDASLADTVCPRAKLLSFDTLIKQLDLDVWRVACGN